MTTIDAARAKLVAARARLIIERPFVGALTLHLPLHAADDSWCDTLATDARALYFNPDYVQALDFDHVQFALAHVALHCALGHFARRAHRVARRWAIACDHAVNLLLIEDGLKAPPHALANREYRGLSAEEIYPLIGEEPDERSIDRHIADSPMVGGARSRVSAMTSPANGVSVDATQSDHHDSWDDAGNEGRTHGHLAQQPRELLPAERDALEMAWRTRAAAAAQRARESGRLSGSWARVLERAIEPPLPWRVLLARFIMSAAREDYSFRKLSRRDGDAILPRVSDGQIHVCAALDTSGSIASQELASFAAELDALKSQARARVTVFACDERLDERGPWVFEPWEPLALPRELSGGAGTSFVPVFDWIDRCATRPDALVYFTDAEGDFPAAPPEYPVLWLVKGRAEVPWGERIQLN